MTVSAPMAIGCVPWKTVVSAIVAVGWTETGARGEDEDEVEEVETRCWGCACGWAEGGLRYWEGLWSISFSFSRCTSRIWWCCFGFVVVVSCS